MNILVLTAYPPVLGSHGGGVRMFHNIRILASRHSVHLIAFAESDEDRDRIADLTNLCASVAVVDRRVEGAPNPWSLVPGAIAMFSVDLMRRKAHDAVRRHRIDVIQCEYLPMVQFRDPEVFTVLTAHEAVSANARQELRASTDPIEKLRLYYRWMSMLRYEVKAVRGVDRVVTMTREDADYLRSYVPAADIRSIPIGVDSGWYAPNAEDIELPVRAVFLGNFRHPPNVEAVRFLVEHIIPSFPDVSFEIVGGDLPDGLLDGSGAVSVEPRSDTRPLYVGPNTIVLAPLFSGTGQRVKLLEAFAMGMPVVTTRLGARGFPLTEGADLLIGDSPEGFRNALGKLAGSSELRRELGSRARRKIVGEMDWERLEERFLEVVRPNGASGG